MNKTEFDELLGPVIEIVDDKIRSYRRMQEKFEKDLKRKSLANDSHKNSKTRGRSHHQTQQDIEASRDDVCDLKELKIIGVLGKGLMSFDTDFFVERVSLSESLCFCGVVL